MKKLHRNVLIALLTLAATAAQADTPEAITIPLPDSEAVSLPQVPDPPKTLTAQQSGTLATIQEVIEKTVSANPEVQNRYHIYEASLKDQTGAKAGWLPKADVVANLRSQEYVGPNVNNTNIPNRQVQLIIRQMLFDGFATSREVDRLDHVARLRYYELLSAMQSTALDVAKAYLDVQRYRQQSLFAQDNYIVHKQLFDRIQERVAAGVGRKVDLEQASGRVALAEANMLTQTTNLHDVVTRYQRLVGEVPADSLPEVDFSSIGLNPTPADALAVAYRQSPDLLAAIENIEATKQEIKGKEAKYMPRLDLQGTKNLYVSEDGKNSTQAADVLGLALSFNLFNGFADKASVGASVEKLNSGEDQRDKACVDTRQTVLIAYNDISQLTEQLAYRDQHQLSIQKAREAYRRQFDIGQRTLLDLLDTENEYFQARLAYSNAFFDLDTAYARTYAGEGELLSKLGVSRADLPDLTRADYLDSENVCKVDIPVLPVIDKAAIVAAAKPLGNSSLTPAAPVSAPDANQAVTDGVTFALRDWAAAWENKDYATYMSFYKDGFVPDKYTREKWLAERKKMLSKPGKISVALDNIKVTPVDANKGTVSFDQTYTSPDYSDKMSKLLTLEKINDKWLISKETNR